MAAEQGLSSQGGAISSETEVDTKADDLVVDPRFDDAIAAVDAGDWVRAKSEYQAILDSDPSDLDAQGGLIMCGIFERTEGKSVPEGKSYEDQLLRADFAASQGLWPEAFATIIDVVRASSGGERELARARAVEYFTLAGEHPDVPAARINLANALF